MSERDLDLLGLHGQRQAALGADLQAKPDGLADVFEGGGLGRALADAAGDRRAFGDPGAGLVAVNGHGKFHGHKLSRGLPVCKLGLILGQLGEQLRVGLQHGWVRGVDLLEHPDRDLGVNLGRLQTLASLSVFVPARKTSINNVRLPWTLLQFATIDALI